MTTLIWIIAIIIVILAGIAWLMAALRKWDNEVMDDIINRDRHEYKKAERESESK